MFNFEEANRKSKEVVEAALRNYTEVGKKAQAIATETTEYSKKSVQDLTTFWESLLTAKSIETVYELQLKYFKSSYETLSAETAKITELYSDLAKSAYKPYEVPVSRATIVVTPNAA